MVLPTKARIAIACMMQESNSFSERKSILADFAIQRGSELRTQYAGTNTETGGFLQGAAECGFEPVPLLSAWAIAGGPLEMAAFEPLVNELCSLTSAAAPDGMLLALHGALLLETDQSGDLEIVRRVRRSLPPGVPLVVTMDLHANVHRDLATIVDGVVGYRSYPHIDMADTALRASRLLRKLLDGAKSANYWLPVPVIFPAEVSGTNEEPMHSIHAAMYRRFPEEEGQYASVFCVQPWLDVAPMGSSLMVTDLRGDSGVLDGMRTVAEMWWDRRHDCKVTWTQPENLLDAVAASSARPVLISEAFDAPNGGSTGDHTGLLSWLLADPNRYRTCIFLVDPVVPSQVRAGTTARVTVGSRLNPAYSNPVTFDAQVVSTSNGDFVLKGPVFTGKALSMGPTCVLRVGQTNIVVGSRPVLTSDPELFRSQGIEPLEQHAIGIKSPTLFRAAYDSISRTVLYLDMPGPCRGNLLKVPFQKIQRPIHPLDEFARSAGQA